MSVTLVAEPLDIGPQGAWPDLSTSYFFSACCRAVYQPGLYWRTRAAELAAPCTVYTSTLTVPDIPSWFLADYGSQQLLVLAGTENAVQFGLDVLGIQQAAIPPYPGRVHSFFGTTAGIIKINIQTVMGSAWPPKNVTVIGHSLGGALAQLLPFNLETAWPNSARQVWTIGAPRVGDAQFVTSMQWPVLAIQNTGDPVVRVPPHRGWSVWGISYLSNWQACDDYYHAGNLWSLRASGEWESAYDGVNVTPDFGIAPQIWSQLGPNWNALSHISGNYAIRLRRAIGGDAGIIPSRGIVFALVDQFQKDVSVAEGFNWTEE